MTQMHALHRSDTFFLRKFILCYQNHDLHKLKGVAFDEKFDQFVQEMQNKGEYEVETMLYLFILLNFTTKIRCYKKFKPVNQKQSFFLRFSAFFEI